MAKTNGTSPKQPYTRAQLSSVPPTDYSLANATKYDVEFYLYESISQKVGQRLSIDDNLTNWTFDRKRPTKLLFHGFTTNQSSPWYPLLKNEYFQCGPHNIIYVDWSKAGNLTYPVSAANVNPVGEFVADFLIKTEIPLDKIHLIGHSLGSHLTGFIGKHIYRKTGTKIRRITALDIAGPGFENIIDPNLKLFETDAELVDVYHTDINYYGYASPTGHVDFYVNGGKDQPGCDRLVDDNCSHARSTHYFHESIKTKVKAKRAIYKNEEVTVCSDGDEVIFGDNVSITARGIYHLNTNSISPFLIAK